MEGEGGEMLIGIITLTLVAILLAINIYQIVVKVPGELKYVNAVFLPLVAALLLLLLFRLGGW